MKLIIFDIDDTLTNTNVIDDICFVGCFSSLYNIEVNKERLELYKMLTDSTDLGLFRHIHKEMLNREPDLTETNYFKQAFFTQLKLCLASDPKFFREIPGAKAFIENLYKSNDCKLAFATGCWSESAIIKLKAIGLDKYIIPLSSSDVIANRKHILSNACILAEEHYQSTGFEKIVYFGDGLWDFKAANELKLNFVGVDYYKKNTFYNSDVDFVINDYLNIESILNKL